MVEYRISIIILSATVILNYYNCYNVVYSGHGRNVTIIISCRGPEVQPINGFEKTSENLPGWNPPGVVKILVSPKMMINDE